MTISSHDNDPERQESILRGLIQQGVRGIILYPALAFENDTRYYKNLEALLEKTSIVCMDRYIYNSSLSIPYVTSDNFYASYQLTRRLIENGHRQIGFVRNYNVSTVIERLMGYKQALHDYGIPFKNDMDILLHGTNEDMQDFPTDWLAPEDREPGPDRLLHHELQPCRARDERPGEARARRFPRTSPSCPTRSST